jgi:hypothetical protein
MIRLAHIQPRQTNDFGAPMQSTLAQDADPQADPHDTVAIPQTDAPSPAAHDPSELHINAADHAASALDLALDPALRAPPLNDNRELSLRVARPRPARRFARFLVATAIGVAATIGWQAYGDEVWQKLASSAPQLLAASPVQAQSVSAEQPSPAPAQVAAEAAPEKPAPAADTAAAPQAAAPVQAAAPAELAPLIEGMSREIASLRQTVEQLKAGQQQISRDLAREQESRRKTAAAAPAPKPVAAPPRNPPPPPPHYSAAAAPPPPVVQQQAIVPPPQPSTVPGYAYVPRPPRPVAVTP